MVIELSFISIHCLLFVIDCLEYIVLDSRIIIQLFISYVELLIQFHIFSLVIEWITTFIMIIQ